MWSTLPLTAGKSPKLQNDPQLALFENVLLSTPSTSLTGRLYLTQKRLCFVDDARPEDHSGQLLRDQIAAVSLVTSLLKDPKLVITAAAAPTKPSSWVCEICAFSNPSGTVCSNCGIEQQSPPPETPHPSADNKCPQCTFENHPLLRECEMCGYALKETQRQVFGPVVELTFKQASALEAALRSKAGTHTHTSTDTSTSTSLPNLPGIHRLNLAPQSTPTNPLSSLETGNLARMLEAHRRVSPAYYDQHTISGPIGAATPAQLARQVSDFLDENKILEKEGGLMSLHHLFAAFNRARYDTVSAASLVKALEIAPGLGMPIRIRTLKNGTMLLGSNDWTSPQLRLVNWLRTRSGASALAAATHFKWSLMIAAEELEQAELDGLVHRDETTTSVLWWYGRF